MNDNMSARAQIFKLLFYEIITRVNASNNYAPALFCKMVGCRGNAIQNVLA